MIAACRKEPLDKKSDERVVYRAAFHNVGGLRNGDPVRYAGLAVGEISDIALDSADPRQLVVTFHIRPDIPMRVDSRATVPLITIPGERYLSIVPASLDAAPLTPGSRMRVEESQAVPEMMVQLSQLIGSADTVLEVARQLATSRSMRHLARTVARMDTLTALASEGTRELLPHMTRIAARTDTLLDRTNVILASMDSSRADLAALPVETVQTLQETRRTLDELRTGLAQGGGLAVVMRDLSTSGRNLARLTSELQRDPLSPLKAQGVPDKPAGPTP
jgi:phospholipid/cholesterol/gamma-HCH transport system substrate-binding protein